MKSRINKIFHENSGLFFVIPSLFGLLIFFLFPFIYILFQSITVDRVVTLSNYETVLNNRAFRLATFNTIRFIAVCLPILLSLSLGLAVLFQNKLKNMNWLKSATLLPMIIPVASVVFFWRILFVKEGFLNLFLSTFNIKPIDWMNTNYAFWILVLTYVWKNLGYNMILWLAGLSTISSSIYEAARIDGATEKQIFLKITLPNLLPSAFIILVLSVLNTFKIYREAYLVAGEYPHQSIYLIQHIFNNWFREMEIGKLSAGSVINTIVMLVFILILQKRWEEPYV